VSHTEKEFSHGTPKKGRGGGGKRVGACVRRVYDSVCTIESWHFLLYISTTKPYPPTILKNEKKP
jgi:hypothetical protein